MPPQAPPDELDVLRCATAESWEQWLGANHRACAGVWLKLAKRGIGGTQNPALTLRGANRYAFL